MASFLVENNTRIQLVVYVLFLVGLLICEKLFPRRLFLFPRFVRVSSHLSLAFLNNILLQLTFPLLALGAGALAVEKGWGLLHFLAWPAWLEIMVGVLMLDLIIYGQHIVFHWVPPLWRLHRVHHADLELDVSSGVRFHPLEILISMGIKIGAVISVGAHPLTVFIFELILMSSSLFNHSNLNIPVAVDRFLRLAIITPDMHRVHHSVYKEETNSNYGFNFPWWDRLFGTYHAQPKDGHLEMKIGIEFFRSKRWLYIHRILIEPFINRKD